MGFGGATHYSESLKMTIFRWQRPLEGTHRITFWLIYILQILCHTSVSKIECYFHNCQCNHEYIDTFRDAEYISTATFQLALRASWSRHMIWLTSKKYFLSRIEKMCECQCSHGQCNHVPHCDSTDMLCDSTDHYSLWVQNCECCC